MPRPQFSIRTLLWLTLVVAAFLGGMLFEREWRLRAEKARARANFEADYQRVLRAQVERAKLGLPY
jgi:hypothetical protein